MAAAEAPVTLKVEWRDHLAPDDLPAEPGRVGLQLADDEVAELVAASIPVALAAVVAERIRQPLRDDAHDVWRPPSAAELRAGHERGIDERGNRRLQERVLAHPPVLAVVEGALEGVDAGRDKDAAAEEQLRLVHCHPEPGQAR
jgi:hypothetical protein